jgi:hypothetical protein
VLVAFLDAHSVPAPDWADSLSRAFENRPDLGGAMGSLENVSERPGTALLAKNSIYSSPEKLWQSTVSGLQSPLPWIPTGNCMYSREALKDVGGFNTTFVRCEDTDLSWRVVLKGYQLAYVPSARVTHYDCAGATSFLLKHYHYGAGAAELAQHFGLQPRPQKHNTLRGTKRLLDYFYQLGFKSKWKNLGISKEKYLLDERFRKTFPWSDQFSLALSRLAIFWFVDSDTCICINQIDESRLVLKDLSALIFKLLSEHTNRAELIKDVSRQFDAAESEIASDVDAFVQQLIDDKILVRNQIAKIDTVNGNLAGAT